MNDLIISVVKDRRWEDIDCYANSLAKSGFSGHKVMFVQYAPMEALANLKAMGFEVIPFTQNVDTHFQTFRYIPAYEYLRNNYQKYRFVLWTDVGDLVFQSDPTLWMEQNIGDAHLIAAKEGRLIKNEGINDVWIKKITDTKRYHVLREEEVLCSGTVQGKASAVTELFHDMCLRIPSISGMQGIDQGLYNDIMREDKYRYMTITPEMNEGFISTCGMF